MTSETSPLVAERAAGGSWAATLVKVVTLTSAVAEGFDIGVYSGVIVRVKDDWALSTLEIGILSGLLPLGIIVGVLVSGWLSDARGRLAALGWALGILIVAQSAMALAPAFWFLLLGRMLMGIGVGIGIHAVTCFISETSPAATRGMWGGMMELFLSVGLMLGFVANVLLLGLPHDWRLMLGAGAVVPALLFMILAAGGLPESPRYLMMHGHVAEARAVLATLVGPEEADATIAAWGKPEKEEVTVASLFETPQRRRMAIATIGLGVISIGATGMPVVLNFGSLLLAEHLGDEKVAMQINLMMGFAKVAAIAVVMFFVLDSYGRVILLYISTVGVGLMSYALAWAFANGGGATTMMVLFCTWACFFEAGLGPVPFVYMPEVWDTAARAKGTGVALGLSRIVPVVLVASFPPVSAAVGVAACFSTFGVCCTLALPFIYLFCPETKQQKLEDLKHLFADPKP